MDYLSWFAASDAMENFNNNLQSFKNKKVIFLQIGAYTGDASIWMIENILTHPESILIDVDTWGGSPDENVHDNFDWNDVELVYDNKLKPYIENGKVIKYKGASDSFFATTNMQFDFIYIDGDHKALSVFQDGANGFLLLNKDGVMCFDDYQWVNPDNPVPYYMPRPAIDAILSIFYGMYELIDSNSQVFIKKI